MSAVELGENAVALSAVGLKVYKLTDQLNLIEENAYLLFLRFSVDRLCAEVLQRRGRSLLVGTPGIGKSMALMYLLKRCLEKRVPVVLERRQQLSVLAFDPVGDTDWRVTSMELYSRPSQTNVPLLNNPASL